MNRFFTLLALSSVLYLLPGCATNPVTGKSELMLISEEQDIEIGKKYAPEIEKQMGGRIPEPAIQEYVNGVGQTIVRISHKPNLQFQFAAVRDKTINAFALPGGFIFVTRGMLESLQTEAQLAGILAHETIHVVARDTANAMSKDIGLDILLSAVTSDDTSGGVLTVADVSKQILGLRYSRKDEQEADLGGLDYLVAARYNPYAMVETMQILAAQNDQRPIEFLSTHPNPESRITYLQQRIQARNYILTGAKIGKDAYRSAVLARLNKSN
jgi:predicted Zn-dependent protease